MTTRPAPTDAGGGGPRRVRLEAVLARQRERDLLGPDPLPALIGHSLGFAALVEGPPPAHVVDLGSGGGVPGLVLAVEAWPEARFTLVDASQRRCTYLELAAADLELTDRVSVVVGRAEEIGRTDLRSQADVVVARSFGPPAVLAECAAPLLRLGGVIVVSDPPDSVGDRWPAAGLAPLGLEVEVTTSVEGATYTRLRQVEACADRFPRRVGVPERRPLF